MNNSLSTKPVIYSGLTADFPFADLGWSRPSHVLGEPSNFIIAAHLQQRGNPVYMETPDCAVAVKRNANGEGNPLVKVGKSYFLDFLGTDAKWLSFLEHLEEQCHKILLQSQTEWFQTEMTEEDMENLFIPPYKMVKGKGGKQFSVRTTFPLDKQVKLFNENRQQVDYELDTIGSHFADDTRWKAIVEIVGIKCSPRNFHLEMEIKQMMRIQEKPVFTDCLISPPVAVTLAEPEHGPGSKVPTGVSFTIDTDPNPEPEPEHKPVLEPEPKVSSDLLPTIDLLDIQEFRLEEEETPIDLEIDILPMENDEAPSPVLPPREQAIVKMKKIRILAVAEFLKKRGIQGEEILLEKMASV